MVESDGDESEDGQPDSGSTPAGQGSAALAALGTLAIKGRAPMTGYDRDMFGPAWMDTDRNGCDTRNDVLRRMAEQNYITTAQATKAQNARLGVKKSTYFSAKRERFFLNYVGAQLIKKYGRTKVQEGGLKIYTTLDLKKQPSVSETIDWARVLLLLHSTSLDADLVRETLNVFLKFEEDIKAVDEQLYEITRNALKEQHAAE